MKASFFKIAYIIISIIIMIYTNNLCMDGSITYSSGRGTCSHHGGQLKGFLWPFLIFGFFIFSVLVDKNKKKSEGETHNNNFQNRETKGSVQKEITPKANESKNTLENKNIIFCPICNSPMFIRTAMKGVYSGKKFYGCSRFPACKGIRNIKE